MDKIFNLYSNFFLYLKDSKIDIEDDLTNTNFLSLSERSLKTRVPMVSEKWSILIKDQDLKIFNLSGVSICWSYTNDENQFIYGGFLFNGFSEALLQDSSFWEIFNSINRHEPTDKEMELLKKLNCFEKQAWGDDGKYGCFLREAGDFPPQIFFYDSGAYFPMTLTLEQYLEAMIASCAVRGWQYFYVDIPDIFPDFRQVNRNIVLKDLELAVELLPKLFPDKDFSYHIKRMDYIKDRLSKEIV